MIKRFLEPYRMFSCFFQRKYSDKVLISPCGVLVLMTLVLFSSVAIAADLPDSSEWPRMPDAYRNKDISKRNPLGMSIYDAAETLAEEEYSGTEVVSLEESKRILSERKKQQEQQEQQEEQEEQEEQKSKN